VRFTDYMEDYVRIDGKASFEINGQHVEINGGRLTRKDGTFIVRAENHKATVGRYTLRSPETDFKIVFAKELPKDQQWGTNVFVANKRFALAGPVEVWRVNQYTVFKERLCFIIKGNFC